MLPCISLLGSIWCIGMILRAEGKVGESAKTGLKACGSKSSTSSLVWFPQMCWSWHSLTPHLLLSPSAAIEALKKAHREEMNKELCRTRSFQQCSSVSDALQKQHQ